VVWGTGFTIEGGLGRVTLDEIEPTRTSVRAEAYALSLDDNSQPGPWNLNAIAICADEPPGYVIAWGANGVYDDQDSKWNFAACPAGTAVIGHGAETSTFSLGKVVIDRMKSVNPTGPGLVLVEADEGDVSPSPSYWGIQSIAVCADV
jgi:hypothetical protein